MLCSASGGTCELFLVNTAGQGGGGSTVLLEGACCTCCRWEGSEEPLLGAVDGGGRLADALCTFSEAEGVWTTSMEALASFLPPRERSVK